MQEDKDAQSILTPKPGEDKPKAAAPAPSIGKVRHWIGAVF